MSRTIVDLFAGPGGWSEGLRMLGLSDIGIEKDRDACLTRRAAGHLTVRADVAQYPPEVFRGAWGLIASPPCPDWSSSGSKLGRAGSSGHLVDLVPRWVDAVQPEWIACEQVPLALGVWLEHAASYRSLGYSTWAGVLNAADFGVPQNRLRAVLIASRSSLALPPSRTHGGLSLFGDHPDPQTMRESLGWDDVAWLDRRQRGAPRLDPRTRITPTLTGAAAGKSTWQIGHTDGRTRALTLDECRTIQAFRPDYPFTGNRATWGRQVGDAIPPPLAAHIVGALTGVGTPSLVATS